MTDIPTEYEWLSPWLPIEDMPRYDEMPHFGFVLKGISGEPVEASLEDELRRELPPGHVLEGCDLAAVAFCTEDPNDFLFLTDDKNRPIACVHLTWAVETNPMWPRTHVYQSLDDWTKQMHKEHKAAKQSPPAVTEAFCDLRNTVWGAAVVAMIPALVLFCFSRVSGEALELIGFINDTSVTHVLGADCRGPLGTHRGSPVPSAAQDWPVAGRNRRAAFPAAFSARHTLRGRRSCKAREASSRLRRYRQGTLIRLPPEALIMGHAAGSLCCSTISYCRSCKHHLFGDLSRQ